MFAPVLRSQVAPGSLSRCHPSALMSLQPPALQALLFSEAFQWQIHMAGLSCSTSQCPHPLCSALGCPPLRLPPPPSSAFLCAPHERCCQEGGAGSRRRSATSTTPRMWGEEGMQPHAVPTLCPLCCRILSAGPGADGRRCRPLTTSLRPASWWSSSASRPASSASR